jgi:hypothetical protein
MVSWPVAFGYVMRQHIMVLTCAHLVTGMKEKEEPWVSQSLKSTPSVTPKLPTMLHLLRFFPFPNIAKGG